MKEKKKLKKKNAGKQTKSRKVKKTGKKPVRNKSAKKSASIKKSAVKQRNAVKKSASSQKKRRQETPAPLSIVQTAKSKPEYTYTSDLPERYNKTYLRAIPKDPFMLFIYWEITGDTIAKAKNTMGIETFESAKPVLRLLDITDIIYTGDNEWKFFDTCIHSYANNWYVKIPEPGRTYLIKYGNLTKDGTFFTLIQSNAIQTPRDNVSDIIDEEWSTAATPDIIKFSTYSISAFRRAGDPAHTSLFQGSSDNSVKNYSG